VIGVSFMTANFVARELGWRMPDWSAGDRSVNEAFEPIETYRERFGRVLDEIAGMGFEAIDLWEAHLSPAWATDAHLETAGALIEERGLRVASLAGWFGTDLARFEQQCRIATAVGAPLLGGTTDLLERDRAGMVALLDRHDLRFGLENHPETSAAALLGRIGDGDGRIGATVDTGWFATHGVDAAAAIEELGDRVIHVHLKDVRHTGLPHQTCAFEEGVVPLRACVETLERIGYEGGVSVEHVPDDRDPTEEIRRSRELLGAWLAA
jgi:L-ribulose-5-phosphate 3-epimerase